MKTINIILYVGIFLGTAWLALSLLFKEVKDDLERDIELLSEEPIKPPSEAVAQQKTFEDLLDAIEWVESEGDANAVGDNSCAVGSFQIHKIYVDDVNRIICKHRMRIPTFAYEDRLDREKSRIMATIYLDYWGGTYIDYHKLEKLSRIHNAGPNGWRNDPEWFVRNRGYSLEHARDKIANAKAYWEKVKARFEGE